jgi:hypothetical protein
MRKFLFILFLIHASKFTYAQNIENVNFEAADYTIKISFDLVNCPENKIYNLNVFFTKLDGTVIYPTSISNLSSVYPGRNKTLTWDYKKDKIEFIGELSVTVNITDELDIPPPPKIKHGPENAALSLILPGWGDFYVNKTDKTSPIFISAAYLGSAFLAYSAMNDANASYDKYLSATTQSSMDENYDAAISSTNKSQVFFGAAASILLYDFIHVLIKGNRNVKNIRFRLNNTKLTPKILVENGITAYQFSLIKTF